MNGIKNLWQNFADKHPGASKWVREGGLFVIVSNLITVFKYLMLLQDFQMLILDSRESTSHYLERHLNGTLSVMMPHMEDSHISVHTWLPW